MKDPVAKGAQAPEKELLRQGWTRRFFTSGLRLEEAAEFYRSMGLEVRLEPARAEDYFCPLCAPGQVPAAMGDCFVIYTRPRGAPPGEQDLW